MQKLSVQQLPLEGKKVLVRCDFNVPMNGGKITDDTRIVSSLPTINYIKSQGAKVIIASHLGRPKGVDPLLSLKPIADHLSSLLDQKVEMAPDCIGHEVKAMISRMQNGDVLLLENVRFYPEEENPALDPSFAAKLADLADYYVDDAFACAHRSHSSIVQVCSFLKGKCAAGFLLDREATFLSTILTHPKRPFYAVCGGAKVSSKIGVLKSLMTKVDHLFIGGAMAFAFLKAEGHNIGDSLCDVESVSIAKDLIKIAKDKEIILSLPKDFLIVKTLDESSPKTINISEGIVEGYKGVDIGPATIQEWKTLFAGANTLFWNGPLGIFENPLFAEGTFEIARAFAALPSTTIIGGGDSLAAIHQLGLEKKITHLSTGGGATLEYIEKETLPGIEALSDKQLTTN